MTGIVDVVTNPGETIKSTVEAIRHPDQTFYAIKTAISESYERDVINGDAYSRANWFSYALGTTVTSIVGTKGLGADGKTGVATTKSAAQTGISATKNAFQSSSIANLLPYTPRPQLAMAGGVPFNALNGAGLKDQLISMAKVESVSRGAGKRYKNYKAVEYNGTTKVDGETRDISRRVFQRLDIDIERVDPRTGKTNYQLMKSGRPPIWKDGTKKLHGLVENGGSFRNDLVLKKQYEKFRSKYWRWRAKQIDKEEL